MKLLTMISIMTYFLLLFFFAGFHSNSPFIFPSIVICFIVESFEWHHKHRVIPLGLNSFKNLINVHNVFSRYRITSHNKSNPLNSKNWLHIKCDLSDLLLYLIVCTEFNSFIYVVFCACIH